ncbi:hypothetical protein ACH4SP_00075 [Streptomyces sp. NPDC021093]|uniref:hypothetical protein n=1 Tax=Streptomyces sp. NPDC021093 TaxID=3365112 RepID=UPI0037A34006
MSGFPGSPRAARGALVGVEPLNPLASLVVFQYNPDEMTRTLSAQAAGGGGGGARSEALRLSGAPVEEINLSVEIDATDRLAAGDPLAAALGVHPQLSALEMLLYPRSAHVVANTALAFLGTIELIPPEAPLTLLVWGVRRVVPVRLVRFSVTEQAYDPELNPTRAQVALGLRVLSYNDLSVTDPGYYVFLAHQVSKEVLASIGSASAVATAGTGVTGSLTRGV